MQRLRSDKTRDQNKLNVKLIQTLSSPIQRQILEILIRTTRPLRPTEITNLLPDSLRPRSSSKIYYHLDRLHETKLIENDKITDRLSLYTITEKGRNLIFQPTTKEGKAEYIASLIAPLCNKSKEEIKKAVLEWIA